MTKQSRDLDSPIDQLKHVMARLRDPETGCPWDKEQNFYSIVPHTIEEAYEVADAIEHNDMDALQEELGDLLLQVIYHSQMAEEQGLFNFDDVAKTITNKMITRHPHVFADQFAKTEDDVMAIWEQQKEKEKSAKDNDRSAIDGVTKGLPALLRAQKLQKKAAKAGYEWKNSADAFLKLEEEMNELKEALQSDDTAHQEEELGDVLFCLVNFARMKGLNSEEALRKANKKFEKRFSGMEKDLNKDGISLQQATLNQMLAYWNKQKQLV